MTARNAAGLSENRIHSDEVARRYGFGGGLVPGVTLYGYLTTPVVAQFGRSWLERGTMEARFRRPVYDGHTVEVRSAPGADGCLELVLEESDGTVCVTGRAGLADPAQPGPEAGAIPVAPAPSHRPVGDEQSLAPGTVLATVWSGPDPGPAAPYVDLVADDLPLYRREGLRHPGYLILAANTVLTASVRLDAWVHVGSQVRNLAAVPDDSVVETRARVADRYERSGHRFVDLDVVWLVEDRMVMTARHTAIYRLRL